MGAQYVWSLINWAMLALGYELLTRHSEIIALRGDDMAEQSDCTLTLLIRRSKSDQFGKVPDCFCLTVHR